MRWKACELHTHTIHSDGSFTVPALAERAKRLGLEAVALTDHNAVSGYRDCGDEDAYFIRGLELTTYYGHILTHGCTEYVDWADVRYDDVERKLDEVHACGGVAGMAHPFCPGTPVCSGCHWDFPVHDYGKLDFIEIWSRSEPPLMTYNRKAMCLWKKLLEKGFRITATAARDWHGYESDDEPFAVTYLRMGGGGVTAEAVRALQTGRAYVTMGPEIAFTARQNDALHEIGDTARTGRVTVQITVRQGARQPVWEKFALAPREIRLIAASGRTALSVPFRGYGVTQTADLRLDEPWLIAELHGALGDRDCELAMTNPIFFEE